MKVATVAANLRGRSVGARTMGDQRRGGNAAATDADKKGNIKIKGSFLKCPTIVGPKQPCGAHYHDGVDCAKMLASSK